MSSSDAPSVVFISGAVGDYSACVNGGYDRTSEMRNGFPVYSKRGDESMFIEKTTGGNCHIKDLSDKGSNNCCAVIRGGLHAHASIEIWDYATFAAQPNTKMLTEQEAERAVSGPEFNPFHATQAPNTQSYRLHAAA
jgi:hypothetical protein